MVIGLEYLTRVATGRDITFIGHWIRISDRGEQLEREITHIGFEYLTKKASGRDIILMGATGTDTVYSNMSVCQRKLGPIIIAKILQERHICTV